MKSTNRNKRDIYNEITHRIVDAIESGAHDFQLPWHRTGLSITRPRNAASKNFYNGVNILALWAAADHHGFTSPTWATYRQWNSVGAQVRKGERSTFVVFYKQLSVPSDDEQDEPGTRLFARTSFVFNADQVDGYTDEPRPPVADPTTLIELADTFVAATQADIRHSGDHAFYRPSGDYIQLPHRNQFTGTSTSTPTESYYATLLHELTHWTAPPTRCNRDLKGRFGDQSYAMEELVADLGSAFLCSDLGITSSPRPDHAAYLTSWLKVLKADKKALFTAASKASEAARFLADFRAPVVLSASA